MSDRDSGCSDNDRRSETRAARRGALAMWILAPTALVGVVVLAATMLTGGSTAADPASVFEIGRRSFEVTLTASGDLQARNETVIKSPLETRSSIVELVDEGVLVEEGQTLVVLSTDELEKQLENELLTLETARSDLIAAQNDLAIQISDNESGLKKAELRYELALLDMRKWEDGTDKEKIEQLRIDKEAAERELVRLAEKLERSTELKERDFLSEDEFKQDKLNHLKAEANRDKAVLRERVYVDYEREMELKKKQSEIEEAEAELDRVKRRNANRIQSREATVTQRTRQLELREQRVAKLQEQIDAATITAPREGMVVFASSLRKNRWWDGDPLKVGTEVRHNEELIVIPDNTEMVARINIHESLVGRVSDGQDARVRIDAARGSVFEGEVLSVGVIAESGGWRDPNLREYAVDILLTLDERNHGLKPSMRCEADLILGTVEDAIAAPPQAVFYDQGAAYVYRSSGPKYERVGVEVGRRSETYVEIASGLGEGDRVLLREPSPGEILEPAEDIETEMAGDDSSAEPRKVARAGM